MSWGRRLLITGILHTSLSVADLDRSVGFYRDILGLSLGHVSAVDGEALSRTVGYPGAAIRVAMLHLGGHQIELIQYVRPPGRQQALTRNQPGAAHVAFRVRDIDAAYRDLLGRGVSFTSGPQDFGHVRACYLLDPDGITLELIEEAVPPELHPSPSHHLDAHGARG